MTEYSYYIELANGEAISGYSIADIIVAISRLDSLNKPVYAVFVLSSHCRSPYLFRDNLKKHSATKLKNHLKEFLGFEKTGRIYGKPRTTKAGRTTKVKAKETEEAKS
jgi:hypothetical protein